MSDPKPPDSVDARRVPPIDPRRLSDAQREVYGRIAESRGLVAGPFSVLLHLPDLADRVQHVGAYLRYGGTLPRDVAELATLVTADAWRSGFEWQVHEPDARRAGVPNDVIGAVRRDADEEIVDDRLRAVARFARAVATSARVPDPVYRAVLDGLGSGGTVELTLLVGYYTMLAMTLGAHGMEPDDAVAAPPAG